MVSRPARLAILQASTTVKKIRRLLQLLAFNAGQLIAMDPMRTVYFIQVLSHPIILITTLVRSIVFGISRLAPAPIRGFMSVQVSRKPRLTFVSLWAMLAPSPRC